MRHLPIFLDIAGRRAIVVGGGVPAARRAETLLKAGAQVAVHAETLCDDFEQLRLRHAFEHRSHDPTLADLASAALCIVATDDPQRDRYAHGLAQQAGVLVNVANAPDLCDFILPSIVDRSPIVVAISTGGASPLLGRLLRARIETMIPAAYGRLADFVRDMRGRVAARLASGVPRRRLWESALDGPVAELVLAGDRARAVAALDEELAQASEDGDMSVRGEVYLVGAGPGDPDLLSFRALRLMQRADVVLYDNLVDPSIVDLARREAERIYVGKRKGDHALPQEEIGDLLVRLARQGKRVLRLKGGDPFVFGRGGEEIETLAQHSIPFQVCPGITAAIGCAAYAGIPLTHRDHAQSVVFVTASGRHGPLDLDWSALAKPGQTAAVYMGLSRIEALMSEFEKHGADADTPAAIVDNGTRPNQRVVTGTVRTLAEKARAADLRGPTIVIVGSVVTLREKLDWRGA